MPKYRFSSDLKQVKKASQKILAALADCKFDDSTVFDIKLCFEEALINAIRYGNRGNPHLKVEVDVIKARDHVEIVVRDQGEGFDHRVCKDPTKDENIKKLGGRGVFLIHKLMDKVIFECNGSCVRMIKMLKRKRSRR